MQISNGLPATFNPDAYDMIVVGAGYAGSVCARRVAEGAGFRVAVLERREHIAGNAYDYVNDEGILVHKYGPHIYHTYSERVHEFLSRFTKWTDYQHKVLANIHGTLMPVPFNHTSLKRVSAKIVAKNCIVSSLTPSVRTRRSPSWSSVRRTIRTFRRSRIMSMRTSSSITR